MVRLKKYEEVISCVDKAILLQPDNANAYNNKGLSLGMLKRSNQEAIWCFDKSTEIRPDTLDLHLNKAGL